MPRQQLPSVASKNASPQAASAAAEEEEEEEGGCSICLNSLANTPYTTLKCSHVFHVVCVAELRRFGEEQTRLLCRVLLPQGPRKLNDEAFRRYLVVNGKVERGEVSWSALPPALQREMDDVVAAWKVAADHGIAQAQYGLGTLFTDSRGVTQNYAEAARWSQLAAKQGHRGAEYNFALMNMQGWGVAQNYVEAMRWL